MEITNRELIASVIILAIMFIIGLFIGDFINNDHLDSVAKYNKALKIKDEDTFKYAMKTNIGNAFIEGDFITLDPVSEDRIDGEYTHITVEKEEYTKHKREVTYKDSKGKTKTKTEIYYTWDYVSTKRYTATKISFLNVTFDLGKFSIPSKEYLTTKYQGSDIRYKYYVVPKTFHGTIFSYLSDNTIQGNSLTIYPSSIESTLDFLTSNTLIYFFWIIWTVLSLFVAYYFCVQENDWLNS